MNGQLHESVSTYAKGVFARHGIDGLKREADRLLHSLETASRHYYAGQTLDLMAGTAEYRRRVEIQHGRGDATSVALELDGLQSRVVQIQRQMDPHTKAALILHVDADKWDRYPSYQAYLDSFRPTH